MTLRRLDWPPFFFGGMVFFGYVGAMVYDWPVPLPALVLTGSTVAGVLTYLYLDGPAVSLTVGPDRVVVRNTFLRYDGPWSARWPAARPGTPSARMPSPSS